MIEPDLNTSEQPVRSAYRDALRDEPPASLDAVIRAAARRAVAAKPQSFGKTGHQHWRTPLAAAATVLLTASVIFVTMNEHPATIISPLDKTPAATLPMPVPEPLPAQSAPETRTVNALAAQQNMMMPSHLPQIAPPQNEQKIERKAAIARSKKNENENKDEAARASIADAKGRAPSPPDVHAMPSAPIGLPSTPVGLPSAPAVLTTPAAAPTTSPLTKLAENADKAARPASVGGAISSAKLGAAIPQGEVQPSGVPSDGVARASAPPTVARARTSVNVSANATVNVNANVGLYANATKTLRPPAVAGATSSGSLEKNEIIEPVDAWIMRMSYLQTSGKNKELIEELVRFRKHYPIVTLPPALAAEWAKIDAEKMLQK